MSGASFVAPSFAGTLRGRTLLVLVLAVVVGALSGLLVAVLSSPVYESESTLIFPRESSFLSPVMPTDTELGGGSNLTTLGVPQPRIPSGAYAVAILKSRSAAEFIIDKFSLQKRWDLNSRESTIHRIEKRLNASINAKNGSVHLSVDDDDPTLSRDILTACIDFYKDYTNKRGLTTSKRQRIFVEKRLSVNRKDLEKASIAMMRFERANSPSLVEVEARGKVWEGLKTEGIFAETSLRQAEAREQELRSRMLAGVEAERSNPGFPVTGGDALLERLQVSLFDARLALANLRLSHSPRTVEVSLASKKVQNIESQISERIANLARAYSSGLSHDLVDAESILVAARAREQAFERLKAEQTSTLAILPGVGMAYANLKRDLKKLETANTLLEMEYQRAMVAESRDAIDLEVLDPPSLPEKPLYPRPRLFTALGGCAGLFVALFIAYVRHRRAVLMQSVTVAANA